MPADRTKARSRSPGYHRDRQDASRRDYRHHDDRRDTGSHYKNDYDAPRRGDLPRARQYDKMRHARPRTRSRSPDRYSAARPAYRPLHDAPAELKSQTTAAAEKPSKASREAAVDAAGDETELDPEADAMAAMMGFAGFGTTKGAHVSGNSAAGAVAKVEKRVEYRQYMNRKGGFNRPLDESSAV